MHIGKDFTQKFTFECKILANGLHYAIQLQGALEGTTVSLYARAKPA